MEYKYIAIIIVIIILIIIIYYSTRKNQKKSKWPLVYISSSGPAHIDSCLNHYRPYNCNNSSNYYGIFKITSKNAYKLYVSSSDYYEVCVYKYPEWEIVYAETNISEIDLDNLPLGEYTIMIHSIGEIKGSLEKTSKCNKPLPESRLHKKGNSELYDEVSLLYNDVSKLMGEEDLYPNIQDFTSDALKSWPKNLYTREEILKINPKCDYIIIIASKNNNLTFCTHENCILQSDNLKAYKYPGNVSYVVHQVYSNINIDDEILPIYVYTFNYN